MTSKAPSPASGGSSGRFYFVAWLALGAAGIFYVIIATLAPEALRSADAGQSGSAIETTNKQVAALSQSVSQIKSSVDATQAKQQSLAGGLDSLRNEVSGIKVKLGDLSTLGQSVAIRLNGLEGKPVTLAAPAGKSAQTAAMKTTPASTPAIEGVVVPDANANDLPVSSEAAADDTQDAAPAAAVIPAPAKKLPKVAALAPDAKPASAAPARPYAIDLAMSTSPDALRQIWQLFKEQHGELLTGLSPRSVAAGGNVRLVAGPFPSQAAAAAHCAKMRKQGVSCSPTPLAGTPL